MINISEVIETNKMIEQENFDVRTITMGINLLIAHLPISMSSVRTFIIRLHVWQRTW